MFQNVRRCTVVLCREKQFGTYSRLVKQLQHARCFTLSQNTLSTEMDSSEVDNQHDTKQTDDEGDASSGSDDLIDALNMNMLLSGNSKAAEQARYTSPNPYPHEVAERDPLMKYEINRYNRGKRWLARMMGVDEETFTQKDVDAAIEYLLPSHLTAKDARPQMKHPYDLFPQNKGVRLGDDGRPSHPAYYTKKPKFQDLTFQIWTHLERLDEEARSDPHSPRLTNEKDLDKFKWESKDGMERILSEELREDDYSSLLFRFNKIATHRLLDEDALDFLKQYTLKEKVRSEKSLLKGVRVCNVKQVAQTLGYRKSAIADVTVSRGSGCIRINNIPLHQYFNLYNGLEQIMHPLIVIDALEKFDVEAKVISDGHDMYKSRNGEAGAVRHGMSRAIAALCPEEYYDQLADAGLLERDPRRKERKKAGRKKARRAFQWVKR